MFHHPFQYLVTGGLKWLGHQRRENTNIPKPVIDRDLSVGSKNQTSQAIDRPLQNHPKKLSINKWRIMDILSCNKKKSAKQP